MPSVDELEGALHDGLVNSRIYPLCYYYLLIRWLGLFQSGHLLTTRYDAIFHSR